MKATGFTHLTNPVIPGDTNPGLEPGGAEMRDDGT